MAVGHYINALVHAEETQWTWGAEYAATLRFPRSAFRRRAFLRPDNIRRGGCRLNSGLCDTPRAPLPEDASPNHPVNPAATSKARTMAVSQCTCIRFGFAQDGKM